VITDFSPRLREDQVVKRKSGVAAPVFYLFREGKGGEKNWKRLPFISIGKGPSVRGKEGRRGRVRFHYLRDGGERGKELILPSFRRKPSFEEWKKRKPPSGEVVVSWEGGEAVDFLHLSC